MLKIVLADFVIERANQTAIANTVLDQETGQMMEHLHRINHKNPNIRATCNKSAANELGSLFQGAGKGDDGVKRVKGTDAFFFTSRTKVPNRKAKRINYARVVCTIR